MSAAVNSELPARKSRAYLAMLQALLPRGLAWTRAPGAVLTRLLHASADELARLDAAVRLLLDEINPERTMDGLEDWERVLGLPDTCVPTGATMQERRAAVLTKLRDVGRQDLAAWYDVAATLGYDVVIEEHWPMICGIHECGDPTGGWTEASGMPVEMWEQLYGYPIGRCGPEEIRYWWRVLVLGDRLLLFRCSESECPELLLDWRSAEELECIFRRDKEAHTLLTFSYTTE